ncbi:hypothetical protein Drorol1_Dr00018125, partial [Drosera rotundifolia]
MMDMQKHMGSGLSIWLGSSWKVIGSAPCQWAVSGRWCGGPVEFGCWRWWQQDLSDAAKAATVALGDAMKAEAVGISSAAKTAANLSGGVLGFK